MAHRFLIQIDGQLRLFDQFYDIPQHIDHVIEFDPEIPPPPHTPEQHLDIEQWSDRLQELMRRERASSSKTW